MVDLYTGPVSPLCRLNVRPLCDQTISVDGLAGGVVSADDEPSTIGIGAEPDSIAREEPTGMVGQIQMPI